MWRDESDMLTTMLTRDQVEKPKSILDGQRLYAVSVGPAHLKDDMPVQIRLAQW